jgi:hypothetical protein
VSASRDKLRTFWIETIKNIAKLDRCIASHDANSGLPFFTIEIVTVVLRIWRCHRHATRDCEGHGVTKLPRRRRQVVASSSVRPVLSLF